MAFNMEPQHVKHDTMLTKHKSLDIWYIEERYGERRTVLEVWTNYEYAEDRYRKYLSATYCLYKRQCATIKTFDTLRMHQIPDESSRITVLYQMNNRTRFEPRKSRAKNYIAKGHFDL
jgi:hypothetical protein